MHLTRDEERILSGERGEGLRRAMEILVALGDIKGADRFIPVKSAHVSGVSYKTIGDAGLELLREWASSGATVKVPTTSNPSGLDLKSWREFGFPQEFAEKQLAIMRAYRDLGVADSCTCTPYLLENIPREGEHIAWAESNAVVYANSILGARTNRESGISALAAALVGKAPNYGLHLDENRKPTFSVSFGVELEGPWAYSAAGYYIGEEMEGIPIFLGLKPSPEEAKALGSALAVGGVSMFRLADKIEKGVGDLEKIRVGEEEINGAREALNTANGEVDLLCIGCPHCTPREAVEVSKLKPSIETWVFTSRANAAKLGKKRLHENVKLICDTCMVVSPLEEMGIATIGVNSAKAAFYCRNLSGLDVKYAPFGELVK